MNETDLTDQNISDYFKEIVRGYGWTEDNYRRVDWLRLASLLEDIKKMRVSYNLVKEAYESLEKKEKKAGRTSILKYFPKNPEINDAIRDKIGDKEKLRFTKEDHISKENFFRWQQAMARATQWNREHHEELVKGTKQPRMPNPDWAYGKI